MDQRSEFKAYDLVAIAAGREAGLKLPTVAAAAKLPDDERQTLVARVADNRRAAKKRDALYLDFERRLRDSGYSGDQVWEWFRKEYGPIGRTSIYRARGALRAQETKIAEIAEQARAYVELAKEGGADAVFAGASERSGQLMFQLLMETQAKALGGEMNLGKMIKIVEALARLQKSRAETDLLGEKLAEMQKAAKAAVDQAVSKKPGGLSRKDVYRILDDVMKGKAA